MRYAPGLPPLPSPTEGEGPVPVRAIRPVRPVEPRTEMPRVVQRYGPKANADEGVGGLMAVRVEQRATRDRRVLCRRLQHGDAFLNTRSAVERRKRKRREGDIITTLDEEG